MKIGIPFWEKRVSPVLDVAENLLIIEADSGRVVSRKIEKFIASTLPVRARQFSELGVEVLICGAISHPLRAMLDGSGITVLSCIAGEVEDVLESFLSQGKPDTRFFMPGYHGPRSQCRRQGRQGRINARQKGKKRRL